jgi:hypothetical protein
LVQRMENIFIAKNLKLVFSILAPSSSQIP